LITAACPKTCNVCDTAKATNGKTTISSAVKQLVAALHSKFAENSKPLQKKPQSEKKKNLGQHPVESRNRLIRKRILARNIRNFGTSELRGPFPA